MLSLQCDPNRLCVQFPLSKICTIKYQLHIKQDKQSQVNLLDLALFSVPVSDRNIKELRDLNAYITGNKKMSESPAFIFHQLLIDKTSNCPLSLPFPALLSSHHKTITGLGVYIKSRAVQLMWSGRFCSVSYENFQKCYNGFLFFTDWPSEKSLLV